MLIHNHAYNLCEPPVDAHRHINFVKTICTENQNYLITTAQTKDCMCIFKKLYIILCLPQERKQ